MCGIAGFYNFEGPGDRQRLQATGVAMHRAIAHRGPDSADVWQDPDVPVVLAHRRLAIVDLTQGGAQPMASHSGRYVIVYNGEIYNHLDLRRDLEIRGVAFKSRSDTEVFLCAVEQWGLDATLQKISGMFAIALWDRQMRKLHLIRDRFGKKPLYVGWAGKSLIFASELKAFHAHPDFTPAVDRNVAAQFMRFGYVCAPHCIFTGVWQMLPASHMVIDPANISPGDDLAQRMEQYWSLRRVTENGLANPETADETTILSTFEEKLSRAVKQRMDCDVPYGSFLSGGIDSSLVTALMQKHAAHQVQTYSIGFEQDGYDESVHAAKVAAHLGTDHHEFKVGAQDALDVVPMLPDLYDEPFADASQIPTYLLSKLTRSHVTVALTGDGGDEILGGYDRHTQMPALWRRLSWMPRVVRRTLGQVALRIPQDAYDRARPSYPQFGRRVHRMAQLLERGDETTLYTTLLQVWPATGDIVPGAVSAPVPLDDLSQWPEGLSLENRLIYADLLSYRPNDLMVKTDRATMAVALEARAPLMDHELCEYSWRLPLSMKIRGGEGKWLLRRLLERHVPKSLFDRPKAGFNVPLHQWLRGPLNAWGNDLLSLDRLQKQNIVNPGLIAARWEDFQQGRGGHANASDLWTALMFQAWHDRWMKK